MFLSCFLEMGYFSFVGVIFWRLILRVFALSDIHVDYDKNKAWLFELSNLDFKEDVLLLAGDLTDNLRDIEHCLKQLEKKFRQVLFVPGNHELWVRRDTPLTSLQKFQRVAEIAADCGVSMQRYDSEELTIVPLLSWYDFSFGQPNEKLLANWVDFRACVWPDNMDVLAVTQYFLDLNLNSEPSAYKRDVISFSHFLPRIDLMPSYIPDSFRYLYPVMGSSLLETQIREISPVVHVYGHSHVNRRIKLDGIEYINNAYGYPSETRITRKELLVIYEV